MEKDAQLRMDLVLESLHFIALELVEHMLEKAGLVDLSQVVSWINQSAWETILKGIHLGEKQEWKDLEEVMVNKEQHKKIQVDLVVVSYGWQLLVQLKWQMEPQLILMVEWEHIWIMNKQVLVEVQEDLFKLQHLIFKEMDISLLEEDQDLKVVEEVEVVVAWSLTI